jgi:hypothetical protein
MYATSAIHLVKWTHLYMAVKTEKQILLGSCLDYSRKVGYSTYDAHSRFD